MIQRYQGELLTQVGPSCWIFVVEAVVDAYARAGNAGYDTSLMAAIINLYPKHDVGDTREKELATIHAYLTEMIAALDNFKTKGKHTQISREEIRKIATRVVKRKAGVEKLPNIDKFLAIFFPEPGNPPAKMKWSYEVERVKRSLQKGAGLADELKNLVHGEDDAEGALMGSKGKTYIGAADDDADIALALQANLKKPAATVGVRQRLKPRNYAQHYDAASNSYDLTGVPASDITEGGYHALMLVSVNALAKTLTYKDPNYGNAKITVTFAHLKKMAEFMATVNQHGLELQSFTGLESNQAKIPAILLKWGKVPALQPVAVMDPLQVAKPPVVKQPVAQPPAVQLPVVGQQVVTPPVVASPVPTVPVSTPSTSGGWSWSTAAAVGVLTLGSAVAMGGLAYSLLPKMATGRAVTPPCPPKAVRSPQLAAPPPYRPKRS